MLTLDTIKEQAMKLGESERARLAMDLLISLPHDLADADDGYEEAMRRKAELDSDPSTSMTHDELMKSLGR